MRDGRQGRCRHGRAYYRRKRAEGKKPLEAIRCLKRRISDAIYRQLVADATAVHELLIPTIILLYGLDIKVAGSLSLAVSLPTMVVAFARYSQDRSFAVLKQNRTFLIAMAAGSVIGVIAGGALLGVVRTAILIPLLALLLVVSAKKVWDHG